MNNIIQYWWYLLPLALSAGCIFYLYIYMFSEFNDDHIWDEIDFRDRLNIGLVCMAPFSVFPVINIGVLLGAIYFVVRSIKFQVVERNEEG